jgi:hypothetical protein
MEVSRMTRDKQRAAEALFDLVSLAEPRLRGVKQWFEQTVRTIDKWAESEGNQGVKRAKDILHAGWHKILYGKSPELSFVKSNKGCPILVEPLVVAVAKYRQDARLMSAVLSIIRMTDLWEGQPDNATIDRSLEVIETSRLPVKANEVLKEFGRFLDALMTAPFYRKYPFVQRLMSQLEITSKEEFHRLSNKRGPNGPLLENAHLDVVTLRHCKTKSGRSLFDEITNLQELICEQVGSGNGWVPRAELDAYSDEELLAGLPKGQLLHESPGKIGFKCEKSGKLRLIAMPDYYTQYAMQPIGDWLFSVLKALPTDYTYNQYGAISKIVQWQSENRTVFSFDQSSCTDLFPIDMQCLLLEKRFNKPLSEAVRTVLVDREWDVTYPKTLVSKKLKWAVGQPLGVYSSWPLMAVTHHMLVQFASWRTTQNKQLWKPFEDYAICGDDIVIGSTNVASSYLKLVKTLGMKINLMKSYISGGNTRRIPTSEFAKKFVWNTNLLYEIKPKQLKTCLQDWRLAVPLLWELRDPGKFNLGLNPLRKFIKKYWYAQFRYLDFLLTIPRVFGGTGLKDSKSFRQRVGEIVHTTEIHPLLSFIARKVRSRLIHLNSAQSIESRIRGTKSNGKPKLPSFVGLREDLIHLHPYVEAVNYLSKNDRRLCLGADDDIPSYNDLMLDILYGRRMEFYESILSEELKDTASVPLWDAMQVKEQRATANLWLRAINSHDTLDPSVVKSVLDQEYHPDLTGERTPEEALELFIDLQTNRITEILDYLNADRA